MPVYTNRVEFGAAMKKKHFFLDVSAAELFRMVYVIQYLHLFMIVLVKFVHEEGLDLPQSWCFWSYFARRNASYTGEIYNELNNNKAYLLIM